MSNSVHPHPHLYVKTRAKEPRDDLTSFCTIDPLACVIHVHRCIERLLMDPGLEPCFKMEYMGTERR